MENPPSNVQEREREEHFANLEEQSRATEEQNPNLRRQLMMTEQQLREKNERLSEVEQQMKRFQAQLREKELEEANLLRAKEQEEETSRKQLREMTQQLTNVQGQLEEKDGHLRETTQQLNNIREQLRERNGQLWETTQQLTNVQGRLREKTQQLTNVQEQLQEKNEEDDNLHNQVITLEERLREKDQEMNELDMSLSAAQRALNERPRQQSPDWVISRNQIQLTDKCLGKGGWGTVVEAKYCGCTVAVKQMYELILSPHNRRLFEREMNIASRCRHPCLLQFIGATNDEGSPLFVTELMESSLRGMLEQRSLSKTEMSVISLDVALALNYLHQKEPSPIIHRDISSANVLLWRQADQWRAKVSDYGTANFMQQTMTVSPGAMIYSAPEALTEHQTVKVCFIYIFVLYFQFSI